MIPDSYPVILSYTAGATLDLTAIPAPGYIFVKWHDDVEGTNKSTTLIINCDTTITAIFATVQPTFAWWWPVAGIGAISIMLLVYLRLIRKASIPRNFLI